jgi:hypothetical protein
MRNPEFLLLLFVLFLLSCTSSSNTTDPSEPTYPMEVSIHVGGTDSLLYSGDYGNTADTTNVNGMVPPGVTHYDEYITSVENDSDMVFARFQKEQAAGGLKVDIYVDDHLKDWQQTSEEFGSVYVTWQPE